MLEIRAMRDEEHAVVGALMVAVNRATYGVQARAYEDFVSDISARSREAEMLVAFEDGVLVGAVAYVPGPASPLAQDLSDDEAGVRMLAVDTSKARRGYGRALTQACIDLARSRGKARLVLHADSGHPPARGLYGSMGFSLDPARDRTAGDGTPLVCYVFDLGG